MKQTLVLDSTQIDTFYTCPTMWDLSYSQNLTITEEEKDAIAMGTLGHKWLELYYRYKTLGRPLQECVAVANGMNPDEVDTAPEDQGTFPLDAIKRKKVKDRCQLYWMTYSSNDFMPQYENAPLVEQGFSFKLFESPEYLFVLEGKIDLIASKNGSNFFVDHKFQLRERKLYNKSIQFRNYALATGLNIGIINYIRLHESVSDKTFVREPIAFSAHEMQQWRSELIDKYVEIAGMIEKNRFPKNRASCSGKFGYPCEFTKICEEPNYEVGQLIKIQQYHQKKEWKPW